MQFVGHGDALRNTVQAVDTRFPAPAHPTPREDVVE